MTRGLRNNNPGNIEIGAKWNGLAQEQTDGRFCTFSEPKYGIRAMCKIFFTYKRRGVKTLSDIVSTWAPPHENPTETYIKNVSEWSGISSDSEPDLTDEVTLSRLCMAFARQENGKPGFDESDYLEGAKLALGRAK